MGGHINHLQQTEGRHCEMDYELRTKLYLFMVCLTTLSVAQIISVEIYDQ
jgi:hypothetical protein